jgi:hypothetical protein
MTVHHQEKSGWHIFTSDQLPGLFLTGRDEDYTELCESLPGTISALIMARAGQEKTLVHVYRVVADDAPPSVETPLRFAIEIAA